MRRDRPKGFSRRSALSGCIEDAIRSGERAAAEVVPLLG